MTNELKESLKPLLFTQRVIWFAMTASTGWATCALRASCWQIRV